MRRFLNVTFINTFPLLLQLEGRTFTVQYDLNLQIQLKNVILVRDKVVVKCTTNKRKTVLLYQNEIKSGLNLGNWASLSYGAGRR
jgi:hypothetical protein